MERTKMAVPIYRNESLIEVQSYQTPTSGADALVGGLRKKWALLREKGYAGDYPVEILRQAPNGEGSNGHVKVIEVFRWRSAQDRVNAERDMDIKSLDAEISAYSTETPVRGSYTQAVRGFNTNFPQVGGVELLKGVCSCLLTVDGMVEDYPMSVKNGIVLMHRSPQMDFDGDGRNEMYLKILMHGGEIVQNALGPIRVEQNFNRPNDGIVKSNGEGNDFPGTAIWRVSWKIRTAMGTILTDPEQPLIFGPATVSHYPPVGTHFHSPTGPVKLVMEETGQRIGTLTPGELTAFDIVVTKDDEIFADLLNTPPKDIFELMDQHVPHMEEYMSRRVEVRAAP
jgi:hypothetical protein